MKTGAVIPAFNEVRTVGAVKLQTSHYVDETVVVDDGSYDGTHLESDGILKHARNLGKGAALRTGVEHLLQSDVEVVVTLDADGQHDPAEIPMLLNSLEGADMVIGKRLRTSSMPWLRRWCNGFSSFLVSVISGQKWYDVHSGFRVYRADFLRRMEIDSCRYEVEVELLLKAERLGLRIVEVPISTRYGSEISSFSAVRDSLRFLKAVVVFRLGLDRWSILSNGNIWSPSNWFAGGLKTLGFWRRLKKSRDTGLSRRTWPLRPTRTDLFP